MAPRPEPEKTPGKTRRGGPGKETAINLIYTKPFIQIMKKVQITPIIFHTMLLLMAALVIALPACSSDSEDEIAPDCDLDNVTYSGTIAPIMQMHCNSCHSDTAPEAGVVTANYEGLRAIALDGRLLGSVNHEEGFSPMPKNSPQLEECPRDQMAVWVNAGAPDN